MLYNIPKRTQNNLLTIIILRGKIAYTHFIEISMHYEVQTVFNLQK